MSLSGTIRASLPGVGRRIDRRGERLPTAWIRGAELASPVTHVLVRDADSPVEPARDAGPLLVMLSGSCPGAERSLDAALASGARVYVLAYEGWGDGTRGGPFARTSGVNALVRRVARPPVSAVWSPGRSWIWFGDDAARPSWRMLLDAAQAEALRLVFLQLFWHHAVDEGWNRDGAVAFRPCGPRPFDVPEARDNAPLRIADGPVAHYEGASGALVYTPTTAGTVVRVERLWCPPSGDGHDTLAALTRAGVEVVWAPRALPRCFVEPSRACVTPSSTRWSLIVTLSPEQRGELATILRAPTVWRFGYDVALGDLECESDVCVLLPGALREAPLVEEETLVTSEVRARSLRECAGALPTTWPASGPLSLTASWSWEVFPPTLPKGAREDPLVVQWRRLDEGFAARVAGARERLARVRDQQGALARTFEALKGALLGFDRTRSGIEGRVEALATCVPSRLGPEGARAKLIELESVEQELTRLAWDVDAEEQKAREERERAEQRASFEDKRTRDVREREKKHDELTLARERLRKFEEIAEALTTAVPEEDAAHAKDREVQLAKLGDDRRRAVKQVMLIEGQVKELDEVLRREFVYVPSITKSGAGGGARFVPAPVRGETRPPADALPGVGRLVVVAKQRYLAIANWDDLDAGEREAARLSAMLVADLEGP